MTGKEAKALSGRSETWLRNHQCCWCGQTLWRALTSSCGAIYERCDPTKKDDGVAPARPVTGQAAEAVE